MVDAGAMGRNLKSLLQSDHCGAQEHDWMLSWQTWENVKHLVGEMWLSDSCFTKIITGVLENAFRGNKGKIFKYKQGN